MGNFEISNDGRLTKYNGTKVTVKIPEGVKIIGAHAFEGNETIEEVFISETVTDIEEFAFSKCKNLSKINPDGSVECNIPENVISIGKRAFENCRLGSVKILGKLSCIEEGTFAYCQFYTVVIPHSVVTIAKEAFYLNRNLYIISIGSNVTIARASFSSTGVSDKFPSFYKKNEAKEGEYRVFKNKWTYGFKEIK